MDFCETREFFSAWCMGVTKEGEEGGGPGVISFSLECPSLSMILLQLSFGKGHVFVGTTLLLFSDDAYVMSFFNTEYI